MYSEDNLILQLAQLGGGAQQAPRAEGGAGAQRPLASVYAPVQEWRELYDEQSALCHGTLFKELEFPFLGGEPHA